MPENPTDGSTDRLRDRIDHGKSGDKVNFTDPAAAPLGTDDEAAGTPNSPQQVAVAAAAEKGSPGELAEGGRTRRRPEEMQPAKGQRTGKEVLAMVAVVILVSLLAFWITRG